jgi:hypothetical protein
MYTELNSIKPSMLAEATRNAKKAAEEFSHESSVKIGKLRKASQGLFTVTDRDDFLVGQSEGGGYYSSNVNDLYKKIRVVINVEYSIQ